MNHVVNKVNHRVRTCATSYALCTLDVINYDARTRSGSFRVVSNIPTRVRHAQTHSDTFEHAINVCRKTRHTINSFRHSSTHVFGNCEKHGGFKGRSASAKVEEIVKEGDGRWMQGRGSRGEVAEVTAWPWLQGFPKAVAAAAAVKEGGSQVQRQAIVTMWSRESKDQDEENRARRRKRRLQRRVLTFNKKSR